MPRLQKWNELDRLGPDDLTKALPPGTVFVDVISFIRFSYVPAENGRTIQKRVPAYAAFVLTAGREIQRIDLGDAEPINRAVAEWRKRIDDRADDRTAAVDLSNRVWPKLAPVLPPKMDVIYFAADGDLARVPWAALPIDKERVLLEAAAVATTPHGAFLLDHFRFPRSRDAVANSLALGDVHYAPSNWPKLPGTLAELYAIKTLAPGDLQILSAGEATAARLKSALPTMRFAHLATHGQFNAEELTAEKRRAATAMAERQVGDDMRQVAAKNPLGYVGIVLAGGEVVSGLTIVDLPLEKLKLATLSACETGLGELTGGEGVQGLQRAFHLAGCPNVVASLWKVQDAPTAALMARFYHELWVYKKPPIEALRESQLFIYHHPDLIPDLAGERGAPKSKEALAMKNEPGSPAARTRAKRADTKLWAAFVLSGAGR